MTTPLQLGPHVIGNGHPCYLICEVGTTCLGNLDMALELVAAAKAAGMDAVKFQMIDPDQDTRSGQTYRVQWDGEVQQVNMREMFSRLKFSNEEWAEIAAACRDAGIEFLATVDFISGVDVLEEIGIVAHKIGAWDTTYRPLIEHIGRTGKPMIVDLGPTSAEEVDALSSWYYDAGGSAVLFLHDFHTQVADEMNMRAIPHLHEMQQWPAGFSSPNRDNDLDFISLGLGACIIEKRLILNRDIKAFHAHESLEPSELNDWVRRIRRAEAALGKKAIIPSTADRSDSLNYYRSICAISDISAGDVLSRENIDGRRPGTGVSTADIGEFLGRTVRRNIAANTLLTKDDLA